MQKAKILAPNPPLIPSRKNRDRLFEIINAFRYIFFGQRGTSPARYLNYNTKYYITISELFDLNTGVDLVPDTWCFVQ